MRQVAELFEGWLRPREAHGSKLAQIADMIEDRALKRYGMKVARIKYDAAAGTIEIPFERTRDRIVHDSSTWQLVEDDDIAPTQSHPIVRIDPEASG